MEQKKIMFRNIFEKNYFFNTKSYFETFIYIYLKFIYFYKFNVKLYNCIKKI